MKVTSREPPLAGGRGRAQQQPGDRVGGRGVGGRDLRPVHDAAVLRRPAGTGAVLTGGRAGGVGQRRVGALERPDVLARRWRRSRKPAPPGVELVTSLAPAGTRIAAGTSGGAIAAAGPAACPTVAVRPPSTRPATTIFDCVMAPKMTGPVRVDKSFVRRRGRLRRMSATIPVEEKRAASVSFTQPVASSCRTRGTSAAPGCCSTSASPRSRRRAARLPGPPGGPTTPCLWPTCSRTWKSCARPSICP